MRGLTIFLSFCHAFAQPNLRSRNRHLASGWDERATEIYSSAMENIANEIYKDKSSIKTYATHPLEPVKFFSRTMLVPIDGIPTWEVETFKTYLKFLVGSTHIVDFGTWVGPTLFFGAQLVDFALGIEADPAAYASVSFNHHINRDKAWAHNTHLMAAAVGLGDAEQETPVRLEMQSSSPGNSCSGVGKLVGNCLNVPKDKWKRWFVNSYPLPAILAHYHVPASVHTFIKVDVESFECKLFPSWELWLKQLGANKPTFYMSFHSNIDKCSEEEYAVIGRIVKTFRFISSPKCIEKSANGSFSWSLSCGYGEFAFSDRPDWHANH